MHFIFFYKENYNIKVQNTLIVVFLIVQFTNNYIGMSNEGVREKGYYDGRAWKKHII